ncbi:hypothetical protein Pint_17601 [Pistacia integerrima]|uniref:Uncharacterized protein n=1 Tax=Pistacia integerrima TaxID=434235 RepID=A0ACC0YUF7_9ROSI|nr:hypothetical protein Pint_17601 [Pistacia integerrima]
MMMMAMSGGRFLQHLLLAVLILFLFQQIVADSDVLSCGDDGREALLVFKQGLADDDGFLSSWGRQLSGFFQNLSGGCTEKKLELLHLSGNKIKGFVPDFTRFSSLKQLGLAQNRLNGTIHKSIGQMFELQSLDLGDNSLKAILGFLLFKILGLYLLPLANWGLIFQNGSEVWDSIEYFNISYNHIKGNLPKFSSLFLTSYVQLDMSSNHLEGPILSLPPFASYINLSRNKFSGSSSFICSISFELLTYFDLSNNLLSGKLPDCRSIFGELAVLNLANNGFSGKIPPSMGSLHNILTLRLSNNFFGKLTILSNCTRLRILDLQDNALSGKIPEWIGESLPSLPVLSLESNRFSDNIPFQLCRLTNIQILDLSLNNISGSIPKCFNNFTALSEERSSHAAITYEYKYLYLGYRGEFKYVDSAWLTWKGSKYEYKNTLGLVKSLDLSVNKLDGAVPEEIMSLVGLIALNLSRNNFSGAIPSKIGQLKSLNFLDLSRN